MVRLSHQELTLGRTKNKGQIMDKDQLSRALL
jgi:hypothetical protein